MANTVQEHLGTCSLPGQMPERWFRQGFQDPKSIAFYYCAGCGGVQELDENRLKLILQMVNMLHKTEHTPTGINWGQNYILASGCQACMPSGAPLVDIQQRTQ